MNAEQRRAASLRPVRPGAIAVRPWPFHDTDAGWAVISNIPLEGMDRIYEWEPRVWPVHSRTAALWMAARLTVRPLNRIRLAAEAHRAAGMPAGTVTADSGPMASWAGLGMPAPGDTRDDWVLAKGPKA